MQRELSWITKQSTLSICPSQLLMYRETQANFPLAYPHQSILWPNYGLHQSQCSRLFLPGIAVHRQIIGSVVQSVLLNKVDIRKTVSVDAARLTAL